MNYKKVYDAIIQHSKQRNLKKLPKNSKDYIYLETHHIIPKSLGGNDDETNLVNLTAREHFICHLLLMKITNDTKMILAVKYLADRFKNPKYGIKINSRLYASLKNEFSKLQSERSAGKNNPMFGTKYIWINDGIKNKRLDCNLPIPDGFNVGKLQKKGSIKLHQANLDKIYITNGIENILVSKDTTIFPAGFKHGMTKIFKKKPKGMINKIWITNGTINKAIYLDDIGMYDENIWHKGFTHKQSNKYSRFGNKNPQFGKHWYHNPTTLEMISCFSDNVPAGFIKGKLKHDKETKEDSRRSN